MIVIYITLLLVRVPPKPLRVMEHLYIEYPISQIDCPIHNSFCLDWMNDTRKSIMDLPVWGSNTSDKRFLYRNVFLDKKGYNYQINSINDKTINQQDLKSLYREKSYPKDTCLDCFTELFNIRDQLFSNNKNYFHNSIAANCLSPTMRDQSISNESITQITPLMMYPINKNILNYNKIFIPLHNKYPIEHWSLGVIDIENQKIYHFNSVPHPENDTIHLNNIFLYLQNQLSELADKKKDLRFQIDTWDRISSSNNSTYFPIPEQDNTNPDCLIFVILFMEALAYNKDFSHISQEAILSLNLRKNLTKLIISYDSKYWYDIICHHIGKLYYDNH